MPPMSASSSAKTAPLSYAERAKKAQNIKPPSSAFPLRPHNTASASTAVPSNTSNSSAPHSTLASVSVTSTLSAPQNDLDTATSLPLPDAAESIPAVKAMNGDPRPTNSDITSAALSIVDAHTALQRPPPAVNVWNVRKKAQTQSQGKSSPSTLQTALPPLPPPLPPPPPSIKTAPQTTVPRLANDHDPPLASQRASDTRPNGNHGPNIRPPVHDISESAPDSVDDPFVVRVYTQAPRGLPPLAPQPPSIDDTESWPEVGKEPSNGTASHQGTSPVEMSREKNGESEGAAKENVAVTTSRKSACIILFPSRSIIFLHFFFLLLSIFKHSTFNAIHPFYHLDFSVHNTD